MNDFRPETLEINKPLTFGMYIGKKPADLLKTTSGIEYLLWLRDAKHHKKEVNGKLVEVDSPYRTEMSSELHFILDSVLIENPKLQRVHKLHLDAMSFQFIEAEIYEAEMRAKHAKQMREKDKRFGSW